jgi:hypothetical protein
VWSTCGRRERGERGDAGGRASCNVRTRVFAVCSVSVVGVCCTERAGALRACKVCVGCGRRMEARLFRCLEGRGKDAALCSRVCCGGDVLPSLGSARCVGCNRQAASAMITNARNVWQVHTFRYATCNRAMESTGSATHASVVSRRVAESNGMECQRRKRGLVDECITRAVINLTNVQVLLLSHLMS